MGLFSSLNPLVKIAKKVVSSIRQQLMQQVDLLDSAVKAPIQAMVKEVTGGIWTGDGADAFAEECSKLFIPNTEGISTTVRTMHAGLGKALDIMESADAKSTSIVNDLEGTFRSIFK